MIILYKFLYCFALFLISKLTHINNHNHSNRTTVNYKK